MGAMKYWIRHPSALHGELVSLIPLEKEHFSELQVLAQDKRIWEFLPTDGSNPERFFQVYEEALVEREKGNHYPFVIYHKEQKKLIGSTRLFDIHPKDRKLEIGWTWLHPDFWGTAI